MRTEVSVRNNRCNVLRRDFGKATLGVMGSTILAGSAGRARGVPGSEFPKAPGLTEYVGQFVASTRYEDIPEGVIELGKKSILDGLGLALAGSRAQTGSICREYLEHLGGCGGKVPVVGSGLKNSPRFAAWTNGLSIYAGGFGVQVGSA